MKIDIILPFKEIFSKEKASAVSITIKNAMEHSIYFENIRVFGQFNKKPFFADNFFGLKNNWLLHRGHNRSLAYNYYKTNINESFEKKIIEIHNRPYIFNYLKNKIKNLPITMHFHNDPQTMKGSKSIKEREHIAESAEAIYFVSNFIKNKFIEGLSKNYNNLHVLYNSVERKNLIFPIKKKEILFVGRLVPEKGAHIFADSIISIAKKFPDWKFLLIGSSKPDKKLKTNYEKKLIEKFENIASNTQYIGFLNNDEVQKKISAASILVMPAIWEEPLSLVAIEGLCNAAVIISSNKGGLPEVVENNGILINDMNKYTLERKILELLKNDNLINDYQKKAWNSYKFNASEIIKKQDSIRTQILKNCFIKK